MKLHITTDYAIRVVSYLYQHPHGLCTAMQMSQELGITYQYFMKIANRLKKADFICSEQGSNGGYRLACDPHVTSLYDLITVMEGDLQINACIGTNGHCSQNCIGDCPLYDFFVDFQNDITQKLRSQTIASIWK